MARKTTPQDPKTTPARRTGAASPALFSSDRDDWATPPDLFQKLDREFHFSLDPCCKVATAKCRKFVAFDLGQDGLSASWREEVVFMNPPYGRDIAGWMSRAARAAREEGATVVALVPCRPDTAWWHDSVMGAAAEIRLLRGRLAYYVHGRAGGSAPFPAVVIVYRPGVAPAAPAVVPIAYRQDRTLTEPAHPRWVQQDALPALNEAA
jgi:phage N-6-adenine-methyltransferase